VKTLGFERALERLSDAPEKKRIRRSRFERRSSLPISAACVVANGMRETLSSLLAAPVGVRIFEPVIPEPRGWSRILERARLYRVSGNVADAAIVLRETDATTLIAALFGEVCQSALAERALSPIECDVLERMANALAANLSAVCGAREGHRAVRVGGIAGFVTFFELSIDEPVAARIGVALSRDPSLETRGSFDVGHLADVRFTARALLDLGTIDAVTVARLAIGAALPIEPATLHRATLTAHGRKLAAGSCGVRNGRYAFAVDAI
jgi:hypothetical protein